MNVGVFESEQKYMNDKRRMGNRFLAGFGVICGLDILEVYDESISIESGVAIDGAGREIVVASPEVKQLSSLSGYIQGKMNESYYLFLQYSESETDAVRTGLENSESVYEKIKEGYTLYLSDRKPRQSAGNIMHYYKHITPIISCVDGEVYLQIPKYIKANEKFLLEVRIVPKENEALLNLKMHIDLKCVRYRGADYIDINFDSRSARDADGEFVLRYICDAMNVVFDMAEFSVAKEDAIFQYNGETVYPKENIFLESVLTDRENEKSAVENCRMRTMHETEYHYDIDICLAKIVVEKGKIVKIVDFPLEQRVYSNSQLAIENEVLKDKIKILTMLYQNGVEYDAKQQEADNSLELATGEAVINLGVGGKIGKRFFSEKISHGLGLGNVAIELGMKNGDRTDCVVYGSAEIFDDEFKSINAELAAKLNPEDGTFIIGLRLLQPTSAYEAVVHWTAVKKKEMYYLDNERKIMIDYGAKSLHVMESVYFSVKFVNMPNADINWTVESENGGTINDNGCYTAPNHAGVFKIKAECADDKNISASAYIVVKP